MEWIRFSIRVCFLQPRSSSYSTGDNQFYALCASHICYFYETNQVFNCTFYDMYRNRLKELLCSRMQNYEVTNFVQRVGNIQLLMGILHYIIWLNEIIFAHLFEIRSSFKRLRHHFCSRIIPMIFSLLNIPTQKKQITVFPNDHYLNSPWCTYPACTCIACGISCDVDSAGTITEPSRNHRCPGSADPTRAREEGDNLPRPITDHLPCLEEKIFSERLAR
jgi:hypothetical protein